LLEIHCRITITKCEYRAIKLTDHTQLFYFSTLLHTLLKQYS
jgi:hypothetical protein